MLPDRFNSWVLFVPMIIAMGYVAVSDRKVTARIADMTGYGMGEKAIVVSASIAPYPFIAASIWVPFSHKHLLLIPGFSLYAIAMAAFFWTLRVFLTTPLSQPFRSGPFRFTRNPLYLSAILVFVSMCLLTGNIFLTVWMVPLVSLQHLMILAEERVCRLRYGESYEKYCLVVPRYIFPLARKLPTL